MDFLIKHKKAYLMIGGTLLPAFITYKLAKGLGANQSIQNIAGIAGLIFGGMITAKMLK